MKTRDVKTITSNEEYVRMRIFDGEFTPDEAVQKLLDLEKSQHLAYRKQAQKRIDGLIEENRVLRYKPWYTRLFEQTKDLIRSLRPKKEEKHD